MFNFYFFFFLKESSFEGAIVGLDVTTGDSLSPVEEGIWDQYRVLRQMLNSR